MERHKNVIHYLTATFLGIGYSPFASGTAATAAGLVVVSALAGHAFFYAGVMCALFGIGIVSAGHVERTSGLKDPGIVVVDELVGIMITMLGIPFSTKTAICGFFLFRALDMFKIYPINKFESLKGGLGIMMDDVMAGLYANIILVLATRWAGIY